MRWKMYGAAGVFAASLLVYVLTLAPVVTFVDSGELAAVVATDGVSHPPGSPFYALVSSVARLIPAGTFIYRMNAFSAFCAAAAVAVTFLLFSFHDFADRKKEPNTKGKKTRKEKKAAKILMPAEPANQSPYAGAFSASLALAFGLTVWKNATVTEVYTLHLLMVAVVALCLVLFIRAYRSGQIASADRWLGAASLMTGLALANYPPFAILAPAVVTLIIRREGRAVFGRWKRNAVMLVLLALGLLPYVMLPLRAAADPLLNWGNPSNWQNFWAHVTAEQYQVFLGSPNLKVMGRLLPLWWSQWPFFVFLLMIPGLAALWNRCRTGFWFTVMLAVTNIMYSLSYDITDVESAPSDFEAYFLPLFWVSAVWIGAGVACLISILQKYWSGSWLAKAAPGLAALPLVALIFNYAEADRSRYTYADDFARSILESLAPNAFILSPDWTFVSPALYLQHVEKIRADVVVLDGELLRRSWYFRYVSKRAPWLDERSAGSIQAFLHELKKFENDEPYDGNVISEKYVSMLNEFLRISLEQNHPPYVLLNLEAKEMDPEGYKYFVQMLGRPPYMTPAVASDQIGRDFIWVPETPAFRLYRTPPAGPLPSVVFPVRPFDPNRDYDSTTRGVIKRYEEFQRWREDYQRKEFR